MQASIATAPNWPVWLLTLSCSYHRRTSIDRPWPYRCAGLWALKETPITRTLSRFRARSTRLYADWHVAGIMCFCRRSCPATPSLCGARLCRRATMAIAGPHRRYEPRYTLSHRNALPRSFPSILGHMRACRRLAVAFGKVRRSVSDLSTLYRRAPFRCSLYRRPSPLNACPNLHSWPANMLAGGDGRRLPA